MSYQQTYRAVSNPLNTYTPNHPSQNYVQRKPANYSASQRSISPLPADNKHHATTRNNLHHPTPSTPLRSFPPRPSISPSITPPIPATSHQQATVPTYSSPASTTAPQPQPQPQPQASTSSSLKLLNTQEIDDAVRACLRVQTQAVTEHGKRPFAALLLAPDNTSILLTHNSISHYQHAESELARLAATQYSQKYLEKCTLVSTWEPCAMCAGTIYWTGIGRVLYAASETKLKELTGSNNSENMTMTLSCRTIFNAGQRKVEVVGPVSSWEHVVVEDSGKWWREHSTTSIDSRKSVSSPKENGSTHSRTSMTIYNPNSSLLGKIGEDGEYKADLKVDWML